MRRLTVYLGDLRRYTGGTVFPLGIGFQAAYARAALGAEVDVRLFIDAVQMAEEIRTSPPDVLGLANYSWNRNINTQFAALAKAVSPATVTVFGGPSFARNDTAWVDGFFARNRGLDFYIAGPGEFAFAEVLRLVAGAGSDKVAAVREGAFPDLYHRAGDQICQGTRMVEALTRQRRDLDEIPSPYLTGTMDAFFAVPNLGPLLETVRGCPYSCTFCCWGAKRGNKVSQFSVDRVKAELDYIAARAVNSNILFFGDANFGMLERDLEIARHLQGIRRDRAWPNTVYLFSSKNSGDRVVEVARLLKEMIWVSLSRQSMDDEVLKNIKRTNLDDETFARIQAELDDSNVESFVEIMYPLPGETRASFTKGMDHIFRSIDPYRTEIRLYQTELLAGSEMATAESRARFGLKTGWRRMWGQIDNFSGIEACEYQEILVSTDTFSRADQAYVRVVHFFMSVLLTYRLYGAVMVYYSTHHADVGIMALIDRIANDCAASPVLIPLLQAFEKDTTDEFVFGDQPPPDGRHADGDKVGMAIWIGEQKRYNVSYALELLYGAEGTYRAAFAVILHRILVEDMAGNAALIEAALAEVEASTIDFPAIAAALDQSNGGPPPDLAEHPAVKAFVAKYQGDVIGTLYDLYPIVAFGHLDNMVLSCPALAVANI